MAKRSLRSAAAPGLFHGVSSAASVGHAGDLVTATPVRVPVSAGSTLSPVQRQRVALVADSLRRDITRFQGQLASPLVSWDQLGHQAIEANVALSFALKSVIEFLPADLQPLITAFVDLRAQVVLRVLNEDDEEVPVNGAGLEEED